MPASLLPQSSAECGDIGTGYNTQWATFQRNCLTLPADAGPEEINPPKSDLKPFPFNNFTFFFTLFSKFFSSFHHCTCSLSVSRQYLALDGIYHPLRAAFPNNSTRRESFTLQRASHLTGFSPSMTSCSKEHRQEPSQKQSLQITTRADARFQIWAFAASLAVTKAIPVGFFSSAYWYA